MKNKSAPVCRVHNVKKEWLKTTFEYQEDDISIRIPNINAWVCPKDGEASFTPETVDELIESVKDIIKTAKRAKKRQSVFTEYVVSVA